MVKVSGYIWGFPDIRGTFLGVPIKRIIVYWGLYWGPLILANYNLEDQKFAGCYGAQITLP